MSIQVELNSIPAIVVQLQEVQLNNISGEKYTGQYEVTPAVKNDVILRTANMIMTKDVTVKKIPQFEVSNESGGKTFIIGEEYFNG